MLLVICASVIGSFAAVFLKMGAAKLHSTDSHHLISFKLAPSAAGYSSPPASRF